MSPGYCWFVINLPMSYALRCAFNHTYKMLRWRWDEVIQQISSGSAHHDTFGRSFAGIALKLEKVGPSFHLFQFMSILIIRCNRRKETASVPKYSLT